MLFGDYSVINLIIPNERDMKFEVAPLNQDVFMCLRHSTIAEIRSVFEWARKYAIKTDISCLDVSRDFSRRPSAKRFEEIVNLINRKAKPYFRIIIRMDFNWFLLLTDKKHIEDLIEIGIRGIEIDSGEYFIQCFLKKELLKQLKRKFALVEIGRKYTG